MTTSHKIVLAVVIGVLLGFGGAKAIHAQQAKTPPAYVIAEIEVTNPAGLQEYGAKAPGTLVPFGGRYLVRGGTPEAVEGEPAKHIVVIAFDSLAKARGWYDSPAYVAIRPFRQRATKSRIIIAEGVAPQ